MSGIGDMATAFATVFPSELPDKTMVASVVLTTRFRKPALVWLGAAAAFTVHVVVAVTAGRLFALLPRTAVSAGAALLFAIGAVVLWRSADDPADEVTESEAATMGGRRVVLAAATVILVAEWGDLTQLATAGLAARTADPVFVGIGALAALWSVAALAAAGGAALERVLPIRLLRRIAAIVFATLAALSLVEVLRS